MMMAPWRWDKAMLMMMGVLATSTLSAHDHNQPSGDTKASSSMSADDHAKHGAPNAAPHHAAPKPTSDQTAPKSSAADAHAHHAASSDNAKGDTLPLSVPAGASWVREPEVVRLKDGDSYRLEARIVKQKLGGKVIRRLAYNGQIPGPILTAKVGSQVKVTLVNKTDVDTTLHSHGLRLDYRFDGVPGVGQLALKPGDSFTYTLSFPDEGVFWYHPHVAEEYAQEMGLYGNYVVEPRDKARSNPVDAERLLMLDDVMLKNGVWPKFPVKANYALMGRFGNVMLINDKTDYRETVPTGNVVRYAFTNVANTRTFRVGIPGLKMKRVGADGGFYEREEMVDEVVIAPSERVIVEVHFPKAGTYHWRHRGDQGSTDIGTIVVKGPLARDAGAKAGAFAVLRHRQDVSDEMRPVRALANKAPDESVTLTVTLPPEHAGHAMHGPGGDGIEWEDGMPGMNEALNAGNMTWRVLDGKTKKENMAIQWRFKKGSLVKIRVFNDPKSNHPMQHPLHFHGQRFAVLAVDGKANPNMVWKDTVLVPTGRTMDLVLDASNPGEWMGHCHIAEHLAAGMMFGFYVE